MTEENNAVTNFLDKYKYIIGVIIIIFIGLGIYFY